MEGQTYSIGLGLLSSANINDAFSKETEAKCKFRVEEFERGEFSHDSRPEINLQIRGGYLLETLNQLVVSGCRTDFNFEYQIIANFKEQPKQRKLRIQWNNLSTQNKGKTTLSPLNSVDFSGFLDVLGKKPVIQNIQSLTQIYKPSKGLGQGKSGIVIEGVHLETNKHYAIKCLRSEQFNPREFQILHQLSHPNIVKILKAYKTTRSVYLVMKKLDLSLRQWLQNRCQPYFRLRPFFHSMLLALKELHSRGILHRDVKPANIMLRKTKKGYEPVLIDFDLSEDMKKHIANPFCGTPGYIAPEMIQKSIEKDRKWRCSERADVFSLGSTIYEILMHEPLFKVPENEMMQVNLACQIDFTSQKFKNLPVHYQDLLQKMLAKNPENRIQISEVLQHQLFSSSSSVVSPPIINTVPEPLPA